jgi:hypothetical protein
MERLCFLIGILLAASPGILIVCLPLILTR